MLIIRTRGHFSVNSIMRREIQNVICETSYVIDEFLSMDKKDSFQIVKMQFSKLKVFGGNKAIDSFSPPSPSILEENDDDFWW